MLLLDWTPIVKQAADLAIAALPLVTLLAKKVIDKYTVTFNKDVESRSGDALPKEAHCMEVTTDDPMLRAVPGETLLSRFFFLSDLTHSDTASRWNIDNSPGAEEKKALEQLSKNVLDQLRVKYPSIHITSAFRVARVNELVGGRMNSQHLKGEAADFVVPGKTLREVYNWIVKESGIDYDQVIIEYNRWIHISYTTRRKNRKQALTVE